MDQFSDPELVQKINNNQVAYSKRILKALKDEFFEDLQNNVQMHVITSQKCHGAGEILVKFLEGVRADIILCGTRNLGVVHRMVLGSTSNYLIQEAPCTVMIVK